MPFAICSKKKQHTTYSVIYYLVESKNSKKRLRVLNQKKEEENLLSLKVAYKTHYVYTHTHLYFIFQSMSSLFFFFFFGYEFVFLFSLIDLSLCSNLVFYFYQTRKYLNPHLKTIHTEPGPLTNFCCRKKNCILMSLCLCKKKSVKTLFIQNLNFSNFPFSSNFLFSFSLPICLRLLRSKTKQTKSLTD